MSRYFDHASRRVDIPAAKLSIVYRSPDRSLVSGYAAANNRLRSSSSSFNRQRRWCGGGCASGFPDRNVT